MHHPAVRMVSSEELSPLQRHSLRLSLTSLGQPIYTRIRTPRARVSACNLRPRAEQYIKTVKK